MTMPWQHILCGVDFSPASRGALRTASELAAATAAPLVLVHVCALPGLMAVPHGLLDLGVMAKMVSEAEARLAGWRDEALAEGAPQVSTVVVEGVAWQEVVAQARRGGHDLIVIGTHGHAGLRHALLGSVAERVVRHAPCSVLTVRDDGSGQAEA